MWYGLGPMALAAMTFIFFRPSPFRKHSSALDSSLQRPEDRGDKW